MRDDIARFVEEDGALLAICGGYQILGKTWLLGEEEVEGLGVLDIETHRPGTSADRLIGNVVLDSTVVSRPVVGYENHAGRTYLSAGMKALGSVRAGKGNNGEDGVDGALHRNVVATYLHGPLLPKNPEVADYSYPRGAQASIRADGRVGLRARAARRCRGDRRERVRGRALRPVGSVAKPRA